MLHFEPPRNGAITIAATFTAEPLLPALQFVLNEAGLPLDVQFAPYHQVFQELLSPTSALATNAGSGVNVLLVRAEDFIRDTADTTAARELVKRTIDELAQALDQYARRVPTATVLAILPPSPRAPADLLPELQAAGATLTAHGRGLPGITLLTPEEIDLVSAGERYDTLGDEMAHIPFTEEHFAALALAITRKIHALRVPAHKVLALDCDETLWRGVVGEDGVEGIAIPPALARLQKFAVDVQAQGALICLLSKNAEADVLEVFEKRKDMVLSSDHIVAHRINWQTKPQNIASLARVLNLGLDSFVFIDDNPVECAMMRAEHPQVVTLQLPPDDEIESFLANLWTFDKIAVTKEDTRRTGMYRENLARRELEESTLDIGDFITSLKVEIDIASPADNEWPRVAQLTHRTNQFNFTTIRRTDPEMRKLADSGDIVLRVRVSDRFGDYGLVGVVVAKPDPDAVTVDTFLLSCRVLGRGVEHAIVKRLGELAAERTLPFVDLPCIPTPKNEPARAFADSIAAQYAKQESGRVLYRIPTDAAIATTHRPGHDPAAVMDALRAEENKGSGKSETASTATPAERSDRYARLARDLKTGADVLRALRASSVQARDLPEAPVAPASNLERKLVELWEEVLSLRGVGVEDDYFALGGTSLLAARMFGEIARRFGQKLPLTAILEFPTVRQLAARLTQGEAASIGSLVDLRKGGARNFFFVHDGDGETLLYLNLARRLAGDLSVYGIEPKRLENIPLAHASIEDMAAYYVDEVRKKQPHGPYLFGGMCAGGVIAYEMASQLVRAGETVDLVAILDAASPRARKRQGRLTKNRLARLNQVLGDARESRRPLTARAFGAGTAIMRKAVNTLRWEISHRLTQHSVRARFSLLRNVLKGRKAWPKFVPALTIRQIYDTAESIYAPQKLSGANVMLVRARAGEGDDTPYRDIYADQAFGWIAFASNLSVSDVDGGHASMLQEPLVKSLASALNAEIERTNKSPPARKVEMALS